MTTRLETVRRGPDEADVSFDGGTSRGGTSRGGVPRDFRDLVAAAHAGDEGALARVIEEHGEDLLKVVRRRLPQRLRTMFDSQDFVQAFWATFFAHDLETARFESPAALRAYLRTAAANRVTDQVRKRLIRPTTSLNRERPLTDAIAETRAGRADTPSQIAIAEERMGSLLKGLPPGHRKVIELKAAGATNAEIAESVGLNEGSVRRILTKAAIRARAR